MRWLLTQKACNSIHALEQASRWCLGELPIIFYSRVTTSTALKRKVIMICFCAASRTTNSCSPRIDEYSISSALLGGKLLTMGCMRLAVLKLCSHPCSQILSQTIFRKAASKLVMSSCPVLKRLKAFHNLLLTCDHTLATRLAAVGRPYLGRRPVYH